MKYTHANKILLISSFFSQISLSSTGFACLENPCIHGVCVDDLNSTFLCYCIDGYTGIHCQTNWNECWSNPCRNGASCIDGIATFECTCMPGFSGNFCETDLNECDSNPCLNNGTCSDAINGYSCNCLSGFSGDHCEIDVAVCNSTNETRCANGGICEEGPGELFTCKCLPGWSDPLCATEINECLSNPCQNGGICVDLLADYHCACTFGFMGKNCEEKMQICETNNCKNNALCLVEKRRPECYCVPDFHGDLCQYQYDECQLGVRCVNGGTCIDGIDNFTCSCLPNLTGIFCECLILPDGTQNCSFVDVAFSTITTLVEQTTSLPDYSTISTTLSTTSEIFVIDTTISVIYDKSTKESNTTDISTTITSQSPTEETSSSETREIDEMTTIIAETTDISTEIESKPSSTSSTTNVSEITEIPTKTIDELTTECTSEKFLENITVPTFTSVFTILPTDLQSETSIFTTDRFTTEKITLTDKTTSEITTINDDKTIISETTTEIIIDKTTINYNFSDCSNVCQNGGTCILEENGFTCICPFDTEGRFCEHHLGVKNAAFNGNSYLAHRLADFSKIDFEFEAKTVTSTDGSLEFKFSCGYQTMLLKELRMPINTGHVMHIRAKLNLRPDFSHCDAFVSVNNTLSMRGDQISSIPHFFKSAVFLYFGGVPLDLKNTNVNFRGFAGCMRNLKISNKSVNIFGDAEDGSAVTECSSLACLSNPCTNGATCTVENGNWSCHCKNGFLGKNCEQSVCDNNPCLFGGTCVNLPKSGYICLCPYGKHGHFCENDIKIIQPYFSAMANGWSSYVAYSIPKEFSKNFEIKFKFSPTIMDQISLLLFIGQTGFHDVFSDHVAVSFIKGYIMLTWNLGSGPRRIFTNQALQKGSNDYTIHLGLRGRKAWLFVENIGNITGRSPGSFENLDVLPVLYIGGHESRFFNNLPHDLPQHGGFIGCIFDVRLKTANDLIPVKQIGRTVGRAVNQCGVSECYKDRCPNMAACLHHGSTFTCLCQDSWYGPLCLSPKNPCDSSNNKCTPESTCVPSIEGYECDCPFGKIGKFCEKEINITDVSFSGNRSFLKLKAHEFEQNRFNIKLEIKPLSSDGLLVFIGKSEYFVSLSLQSGTLELRIKGGKNRIAFNLASVRSSRLLIQGAWHHVKFGIFGRKIYLSVENIIDTAVMEKESYLVRVKENIFLGGLADMSKLPSDAQSGMPSLYIGCIRSLEIDSNFIPLDFENIEAGRNLQDCDGTPCGGDVCRNGGTCWLDSFKTTHCNCPTPFYGRKCEKIYNCTSNLCNNMGKCNDNKCYCVPGRNGFFCENEIIVKVPEFKKGSYLVIDKKSDRKRGAFNAQIDQISINFTTASMEGLLLWHRHQKSFIGLGIEKGHLKLAYSTDDRNKFSAILWNNKISDGLWHNVQLKFAPFSIRIDEIFFKKSGKTFKAHNFTIINGKFYLGSVPSKNLTVETNGFFKYPFEGCIESFTENSDKIRDFTKFDGLDVDVCRTF